MKIQRILHSPLILILIVSVFFACGGGGGDSDPSPPPIEAGTWRGPSDFGEIEFVVSSDGEGIERIKISFIDFSCGDRTINGTMEKTSNAMKIVDDQFSEEIGMGAFDKITIQGTFDSENTVSGDFEADLEGNISKCIGEWSATPDKTDSSLKIDDAYLQYRNYENSASNRYTTWIGVTKDGAPADPTDVNDFQITDSSGNLVIPNFPVFYVSPPYYFYNCRTTPCTQSDNNIDSGFSGIFDDLTADNYQMEVETADSLKFTLDVNYPGQLVLPFVSSSTMQSDYQNGDLVLSWTNPDDEANWDEVDQLRIVIFAADGAEAIYIRANSSDETLTIPASLVDQASNLGHGALSSWQIQTRAYDTNGMNYARGYSNEIDLLETSSCGTGLPLSLTDLNFPTTVVAGSTYDGTVAYQGSFEDVANPLMMGRIPHSGGSTYILHYSTPTTQNCVLSFRARIPNELSGTGPIYFRLIDFDEEIDFVDNWEDTDVSNELSLTLIIN